MAITKSLSVGGLLGSLFSSKNVRGQPFIVLSSNVLAPGTVPADLVDSEHPNPGQKTFTIYTALQSMTSQQIPPHSSRWQSTVLTCVLGNAGCVSYCTLATDLFGAEVAFL